MARQRKPLTPAGKKIMLFSISIVCIVVFFILPANRDWFQDKIWGGLNGFDKERRNLDEGYRMQHRFDSAYIYSKQIEKILQQKGAAKTALVLLPSTDYFKQNHINYHVPEPVVFYYFTGIKTLWANCSNAADANWYVKAVNGKLVIDTVANKQALRDTIAAFKKFNISL